MKIGYLLNIVSLIFWGLYCQQISICIGYAVILIIGIFILKILLKSDKIAIRYYSLFFFFYSSIVIITQIELIKDPYSDFYIHNDASDAFFPGMMDIVLPCKWSQIVEKTLLNPFFVHYPLSALLMGLQAKLGTVFGIINLRLFLRLHSVFFGSLTIAIMTNLLNQYKFSSKDIFKLIFPFGLCTYIFITSAIFSRDIDVCFAYTFAAYICLSPKFRNKFVYFVLLFIITLGFRPENGLVFIIFPFMYYFNIIKEKLGLFGLVILLCIVIGAYLFSGSIIIESAESIKYYNALAQEHSGGLFEKFYNLPFPLNSLVMMIYIIIMPVPIQGFVIGEHESWVNLPCILSPYILIYMLIICFCALKQPDTIKTVKMLIVASIIALFVITLGSPDLRRTFAAIPSLYLCFCLYREKFAKRTKKIRSFSWSIVFAITLSLSLYTLI